MIETPVSLNISIGPVVPPEVTKFVMGSATSLSGGEIGVSSRSLTLRGRPWLPVMGEFHFSRCAFTEWRRELLKMKAGGIVIVSTYVFWIHHEELEGEWDWSSRRNLRAFAQLCGELGLFLMVRIGPWCHGEVRNGGFPDWLLRSEAVPRTDDLQYLTKVTGFFRQISRQLAGLLWKDGGPVIGVQCENEYSGPAEHMLTLKQIAIESGLDVPLFTRTGWPELSTELPLGEFMPMYGGYPDGFWDRTNDEMPIGYRLAYIHTKTRADGSIATDLLGARDAVDREDDRLYPYFACEIGGGMSTSYHRRIRIEPADIMSLSLVKLGCGNNLQGYYMYHGGTNPEGAHSSLQESQATGYWNDVPVKSYDFQAPLGEYGQVRPHYQALRRLHLFLKDFGHHLAEMPAWLPEQRPQGHADIDTVRWAVRANNSSGFLFLNNYQRLQAMPIKESVQFTVGFDQSIERIPLRPTTIPANSSFFWPINMDLDGVLLKYATAQPLCLLASQLTTYFVFAETTGVPPEYVLELTEGWEIERPFQMDRCDGPRLYGTTAKPGTSAAIIMNHPNRGRRVIIVLSEEDSLRCWKETIQGEERLFLTDAVLSVDPGHDGMITLTTENQADLSLSVLPAPKSAAIDGQPVFGVEDGLFRTYSGTATSSPTVAAHAVQLRRAGQAREIPIGAQGVAESPEERDFDQAAVWRIHLSDYSCDTRVFRLRIHYVGDVARCYVNGKLQTDNFYNGAPFEVRLPYEERDGEDVEILLKILPLKEDAPLYIPQAAKPCLSRGEAIARVYQVEVVSEGERSFVLSFEPYSQRGSRCV